MIKDKHVRDSPNTEYVDEAGVYDGSGQLSSDLGMIFPLYNLRHSIL